MAKINKHIEIVSSTDTGLSSMSHTSRRAILSVLCRHYSNVKITLVDSLSDLEALVLREPDLVFLGMKYLPNPAADNDSFSQKIWISDYLTQNGITHTGSGGGAHLLELDKSLAKKQVISAGLCTSKFYIAEQNQPLTVDSMSLKYPVFIKPVDKGGGVGIDSYSVAHDFKGVVSKVKSISTEFESDSLIEEYLPGREFSVAILKNGHDANYIIMPIELIAETDKHGSSFLGGDVKSSNNEVVLQVVDPEIKCSVDSLAMAVFEALGARDYGRIDIRMDSDNTPHFLEANLIPSLIEDYGSFPKACVLNVGLDYEHMILRITNLALARDLSNSSERPQLIPALLNVQPA